MGHRRNEKECLNDRKCPIHGCALQKYNRDTIDAWYCKECDCYYLDSIFQNTAGKITILGKQTSFFPKHDFTAESEKPELSIMNCASGGKKERRDYAEAILKTLPSVSKIQFCPVHDTQLDGRLAEVRDENGWKKELPVGLCPICMLLFTNNPSVTDLLSPNAFDIPVIWNPKVFQGYSNGKKKSPVFQRQALKLQDAPVHIQEKLSSKARNILATATNRMIAPDGHKIVIQGQYSARERKFICTLENYLDAVPAKYDPYIVRVDPPAALKKIRESKSKIEKQRREKLQFEQRKQKEIREKLEEAALPYLCYTLPLLKGDTNQCPFCKNTLVSDRVMRIALYKDQKIDTIALQRGLYCPHCEVPFIDRTLEDRLLLKLEPKMIYVFDANACRTPKKLLEQATEKILCRKSRKQEQNQAQLPAKAEKVIDQEKYEPLNLSYQSDTRVFVYAERCHCTACERKYGKDMIQNRTALVETISHHRIQVTVQFCAGCGKYYMNLATFQQYCKRYGGILLECVIEPDLCRKNASWLNFNPDSILSRCGYSVKECVSKEHRQTILSYILDSGRATKHEIIELISGFIRLRQKRLPGACSRWKEDLLFVSQYRANKQTQVKGLTFHRAK